MRRALLVATIALGLLAPYAFGCTCVGLAQMSETEWVKEYSEDAAAIVLARVSTVTGEFENAGRLAVLETFKGKPQKTILVTTGICQDFPLKAGDERVFFLEASNEICGCSDYRDRISNEKVIAILKRLRGSVQPNTSMKRTRER